MNTLILDLFISGNRHVIIYDVTNTGKLFRINPFKGRWGAGNAEYGHW